MKVLPIILLMCSIICSSEGKSQPDISGRELLDKSIAYHDPGSRWKTFNDTLNIKLVMPGSPDRRSIVGINLPEEKFYMQVLRDSSRTTYELNKGVCRTSVIDSTSAQRTPCETARLYKDYYSYLYGLPMKLKDPGTNIHPEVETKSFKGKEYLVLKVTYEESVGSDAWFFYFDPKSYAMEIYQFYKGDPESEGKNTGEYILLSEEKVVSGIRMPKIRTWYYNKDDEYLGTDILE